MVWNKKKRPEKISPNSGHSRGGRPRWKVVTLSSVFFLTLPLVSVNLPLYPLQAASLDRLVLPTKLCESGGMNNGFTLVRRIHKHSFINVHCTHLYVQMYTCTLAH